ncbi:MAG: DUF4358 domain-containing protein [Oscillospiraceae bacterium]
MKKLLILLAGLLVFSACGGKAAPKTIDMEGFTAAAVEKLKEDDELVKLSAEKAADFYDLTFDGLGEYIIYISGTRATSDEVCIMKLADNGDAVTKAKESVNKRLTEQKADYELYIPAEFEKLNKAVVLSDGNYVVFVSGLEADVVKQLIESNKK